MAKDYSEEFPAPPWPSPHSIRLKAFYDASTTEELAAEPNTIRRHVPLARYRGAGEDARLAGTYGSLSTHEGHPDDVPVLSGGGMVQLATTTLDQAKKEWASTRHIFEEEQLEKILQDPDTVLTIRDVMQNIPDWKLLDPSHHAFARRALPLTEQDLKGQEWRGKKADGSAKQNGEVKTNGHALQNGHGSDSKADSHEDAAPEDKAFADAILREMATISSFKNASGKVKIAFNSLARTPDAWKQLEMRIQVQDQGTPDSWIPRSDELHRLTGKHPLNAEPDMKALYAAGMITPTKLHYVRSHGAVPCLDWDTHKLSVGVDPALCTDEVYNEIPGLRKFEARKFSMDELAGEGAMGKAAGGAFEVVELPVTIACTGNRRGEVNTVKRSSGYSWGASAVSTCVWRGVFVHEVLRACGLEIQLNHSGRRLYLHYEGADSLSEGTYATSIPLMHALDPCNDVLLAFGQNGRVLHPDHGFPLRSVIPGYAGGRCIKWLSKIWISDQPSTNHYHIWDNRVLPSHITSKETLLARALFHHPDTEASIQLLQSVICVPAHRERIAIPEDPNEPFTVRGFAYHGGGIPIHRVEISLDGGRTWKYCWRQFTDEPLRHGSKYWAWVFWHCDVKYTELLNAKELIVRAWDAHKSGQAEQLTWNILGMMNNSWYRVKLAAEEHPSTTDTLRTLTALHPIAPGAKEGGWMKPQDDREHGEDHNRVNDKKYTLEEVAKHDSDDDCWIILDNKVYDVTSVLAWHPGGAKAISVYAGRASVDATTEYNGIHDAYANSKRDECYIGDLNEAGIKAMREDEKRAVEELAELKGKRRGLALMPDTFCSAKLKERKDVTKDTRVYTFELPKTHDGKSGKLGLPIGKHVVVAFHFKDQACSRSYTPVRPVLPHEEDGTFDLLVKTYLPNDSFPPGGTMSNFLDVLADGQEVDIRGPTGEIEYLGNGRFLIEGKDFFFSKINLVAGGSGLTPHWQLIHAILSTDGDQTQVSLIDSNKTPEDILMREELERYAETRQDQFKLWHTIGADSKPKGWKSDAKHLDEDMMKAHLFPPSSDDDVGVFMCGPPGLIKNAAVPGLKAMGFEDGKTLFGF